MRKITDSGLSFPVYSGHAERIEPEDALKTYTRASVLGDAHVMAAYKTKAAQLHPRDYGVDILSQMIPSALSDLVGLFNPLQSMPQPT